MNQKRAQISATTFIFFMILSIVIAGYVIRTFVVPAVTSFEQGTLVKSIANVKTAFTAVCEGRSVGQQLAISVPAKGVFLVIDCPTLVDTVTGIVPINGNPLPSETVDELKAKCQENRCGEKGCGLILKEDCSATQRCVAKLGGYYCVDDPKCSAAMSNRDRTTLLAYGWDNSWDWWFVHKANIEIKSELIACGKPVSAMQFLGKGDYQRQLRFEYNVTDGIEMVRMT